MGKSSKKNKSDKINALRKQYDAFLEEDKKRKDRNEYILGRMETMRSCSALVKAYTKTEKSDYPTQPKYKSTKEYISNSAIALSDRTHVPQKYLNQDYDETSVLREISKKYFLIPKAMSNDLCNVKYKENDRDPSPSDDTDWKSKYNILEQLKREEKGDQSNNIIYEKQINLNDPHEENKETECIPQESNGKSIVQNNSHSLEFTPIKLQTDMFSNKGISYDNLDVKSNQSKEKRVDKTLTGDNIMDFNLKKQELVPPFHKLHEVNLPTLSSLPKVSQMENINKQNATLFSTTNKINEIKESNELSEGKLTSKLEPIEAFEDNKYVPEEKCIKFNEPQDNTGPYTLSNANNNLSPNVNNENTLEIHNENIMETNNENILETNNENIMETRNENIMETRNENIMETRNENTMQVNHENKAFPIENIEGNKNTVTVQDDPAIDIQGHQKYQLKETDLNQIPNVEHNVTSEVNDELETEQKEMFYNEDNDKNNEYNEIDSTAYKAEKENYVNQEYSYYDESQKEQSYPTEINEHEEATERYDPNYEQQYGINYEDTMNTQYQPEQYNVEDSYDQQQNMYDQQGVVDYQPENPNYDDGEPNQNIYYANSSEENAQYEAEQDSVIVDQQNIGYTNSEDYEAQQQYIDMHAKPLQIENVEQQLDIEDGYIPSTNIVAENQDYQEVIEETTPEIQQTDIQVT